MAQKILYVCANCHKKFEKIISNETNADGSAGVCPHCLAQDGSPDLFEPFRRKIIN